MKNLRIEDQVPEKKGWNTAVKLSTNEDLYLNNEIQPLLQLCDNTRYHGLSFQVSNYTETLQVLHLINESTFDDYLPIKKIKFTSNHHVDIDLYQGNDSDTDAYYYYSEDITNDNIPDQQVSIPIYEDSRILIHNPFTNIFELWVDIGKLASGLEETDSILHYSDNYTYGPYISPYKRMGNKNPQIQSILTSNILCFRSYTTYTYQPQSN